MPKTAAQARVVARLDDDGVLRANGDALRFRGVNRHEWHPERGRAVTVEDTRRDFSTMVDHHVNAVRTSHYPPAAHALDLADEMGLWVVLEGDLETHGFVTGDWAGNPSNDPAWRTAILDRTARMWHRDKNHPSVAIVTSPATYDAVLGAVAAGTYPDLMAAMPAMSRIASCAAPDPAFQMVHQARYDAFLALQNAARAIRAASHS